MTLPDRRQRFQLPGEPDGWIRMSTWMASRLLQAAEEGLHQVYWSQEILDEATRNLVKHLQIAGCTAGRSVRCRP